MDKPWRDPAAQRLAFFYWILDLWGFVPSTPIRLAYHARGRQPGRRHYPELEERFSDFKTAEGLTLPTQYLIHFTEELQNGTSKLYECDVSAD